MQTESPQKYIHYTMVNTAVKPIAWGFTKAFATLSLLDTILRSLGLFKCLWHKQWSPPFAYLIYVIGDIYIFKCPHRLGPMNRSGFYMIFPLHKYFQDSNFFKFHAGTKPGLFDFCLVRKQRVSCWRGAQWLGTHLCCRRCRFIFVIWDVGEI